MPEQASCLLCGRDSTSSAPLIHAVYVGCRGFICETCRTEGQITLCDYCGTALHNSQIIRVRDRGYCVECYTARVRSVYCGVCGEPIMANTTRYISTQGTDGAVRVTHTGCETDDCVECESCGSYHLTVNRCSVCSPTRIHEYSYTPNLRYCKGDNSTEELFLGIELEVDRTDDLGDHNNALQILPDWVYSKRDSSLRNGFEVVTMPVTPTWLSVHKSELCSALPKLYRLGYLSGESGTCGIHIHMSRVAFGHLHLYKFMDMIYNHPSLTLLLSQRDCARLDRWANGNSSKSRLKSIAYRRTPTSERHVAVNISNKPTVELRIFNGTLNPLAFMKSADTAMALYRYTNDTSLNELDTRGFISYVKAHKHLYPYLAMFLSLKVEVRDSVFGRDEGPLWLLIPEKQHKSIERLYNSTVGDTTCVSPR